MHIEDKKIQNIYNRVFVLDDRRKWGQKSRGKHKLLLFYKMQNDLSPEYLTSLVPPTDGNNRNYNPRNSTNLQTMHSNIQLYYKSFLPSVIRDWKDLPQEIQKSDSFSTFKRKLNADLKCLLHCIRKVRVLSKRTKHDGVAL